MKASSMNVLPALALVVFMAVRGTASASAQCKDMIDQRGCFSNADKKLDSKLLIFDRSNIQWFKYPSYLQGLVCRCSKAALKGGYELFGIQYWGECWGYKGTESVLTRSSNCHNVNYTTCDTSKGHKFCTGTHWTAFIYQNLVQEGPIDGGYSQWTGWSECSASCGGGVALRTRKCDNPKPTRKGQNCERLGPADNSRKCNQAPCSAPFPYPTKSCGKVMHQSGMDRLEASLPYEAGKKFCRVLYPSDVAASSRNYVIRVQMYNEGNDKGSLSGSSGLMFNVQDINNFQFVYVKLNGDVPCYSTAVIRNGKTDFWGTQTGDCPAVKLEGKKWIQLMLQMTDKGAMLKADGHYIATIRNSLPKKPRGGVLARNGQHNVVKFKNYVIYGLNF
eukprot:Seg284.3_Seg284.4 transcript_id=Seg284.3_Seg284.4/GoldUCD/mRNA.D3Y31 product="putative skeletal organic matrix protein 7" protein_id=Seg284.3_Seg284.4/GoldUCD/D3Y31